MAYVKIDSTPAAARVRPARGPFLADDLERYFPAPLPERYREQMRRPPPAARDHRHASSPTSSSTAPGTTFAFRLREETGALAGGPRAGLRGRARGVRDALVLASRSRRSTTGRGTDPARDADRGSAAGRARYPLAGARQSLPVDVAQTIRALSPRRRAARGGAAGRARGRGPRRLRRARGRAPQMPACPPSWPGALRGMPSMLALFDIVEVTATTGRNPADVLRGLLPRGLAPGAQLAARPDHRAPAS